ncbi:MAG: DUF1385 domain-containing protein [Candidatus Woesearchaeota archaeon]
MGKQLVFGGQAVMEGVLMKSPHYQAVAVRTSKGKIAITSSKHEFLSVKNKWLNVPFIRGAFVLFETMILGIKALSWSANASQDMEDEKLTALEISLTLALSLGFALVFFKLVPLLGATLLSPYLGNNNFLFNLADGLIKILILVGYLWLISYMKDIRRMFQYHGAEHMAVNCYESGKPLTVKNCMPFTTINGRCGTSFILFTLILSIIVYLIIPFGASFWEKYLFRILLLPVIGGISYEAIRLSHKYPKSILLKIILGPGLLTQKITTKPPKKNQVEVAIKALKRVLSLETKALSRHRVSRGRLRKQTSA